VTLITIIGRGHSGTRAISHTLSASGVFMGSPLNASGDLLPPEAMYDACRIIARHIHWKGGLNWDFREAHSCPIPEEFVYLIDQYLTSVTNHPGEHKGWKIPETTLVYPWLARLYPDIKYIFWIRDPRDCILGAHLTDDMSKFGIEYPATDDERLRRAISWKYQYDLVKSIPKPENWLEIRFEDFVLKQDETLKRLEDYLGIRLAKIPVQPEAVGRWQQDESVHDYDFFAPALADYSYRTG
jgi:sulfotransferase family protein